MTRQNAPAPAPTASGTCPRAANRQQPLLLGLLAGTFQGLAATYGSSPLRRPASVGYRRGRSSRSGAKMQMQPATLPLDLVDPALAVPRNQAPSPDRQSTRLNSSH